jgi:peptide/nickel transport system permease protein
MTIGSYAAYRRGKPFDLITTNLGIFFWGMPYFWLALLLKIIFMEQISPIRAQPPVGLGIQWWPTLPSQHYYDYTRLGAVWQWEWPFVESAMIHLILPVASLTIGGFLGVSLIMRNSLIDVMTEDYIVTARAKGLSHREILKNHAVPNGMPPMITLIALYTASILGGAYQVEYVFVYQGLGYDTIQAVFANDYPLLQFILVIGGIAIVIANLIADFILIKVDPRIKIA